jgi:hypothetical protein
LPNCILQTRQNIFSLEVWIIFENLLEARAGAEQIENIRNPNPHSAHTRASAGFAVLNGDSKTDARNPYSKQFYRDCRIKKPIRARAALDFAVIRIMPRVEREESLNAGVTLFLAGEKTLRSPRALRYGSSACATGWIV